MKYLVTGGAGFIGSHLTRYLVSQGHEVSVLDNLSTGKHRNLEGLPVKLIIGDVRHFACVESVVQGQDAVFHQAALSSVSRSMADPVSTHEVNATGTLNVLEACRRAGVKRLVYASSSSVYGNTEVLPKEETMTTTPLSPYAMSKMMGEQYAQLYWRLHGLESVGLRYFNVFGPNQDPNSEYAAVIPKFVQGLLRQQPIRIFGDGLQTRDFTYVANVVQANVAACESPLAAGQVINVACGKRWSLMELVDQLETEMKCQASIEFSPSRAGDVKHSQASLVRAKELLGFSPRVEFEEGIKQTVAWYEAMENQAMENRDLQTPMQGRAAHPEPAAQPSLAPTR